MTITNATANLILDSIAFTVKNLVPTLTNTNPTTEVIEDVTRDIFIHFCNENDISNFGEDENFDYEDDVDESNYDPYSGCDIYEIDECF